MNYDQARRYLLPRPEAFGGPCARRVRHGEPLVCLNSAAESPPVGRRQAVVNPCEPPHEMRVVEGDHRLSNQT